MIESFKCKDIQTLLETGKSRKFNSILKVALQTLDMFTATYNVEDLRIPLGNRFEALHGYSIGQYSIRINDNTVSNEYKFA